MLQIGYQPPFEQLLTGQAVSELYCSLLQGFRDFHLMEVESNEPRSLPSALP